MEFWHAEGHRFAFRFPRWWWTPLKRVNRRSNWGNVKKHVNKNTLTLERPASKTCQKNCNASVVCLCLCACCFCEPIFLHRWQMTDTDKPTGLYNCEDTPTPWKLEVGKTAQPRWKTRQEFSPGDARGSCATTNKKNEKKRARNAVRKTRLASRKSARYPKLRRTSEHHVVTMIFVRHFVEV